MNKRNLKRAIKHFEKMNPEHFDFSEWMTASYAELEPFEADSAKECFIEYGEVPCGTVACVAGEIQLQFAKKRKDRDEPSFYFAADFLGLGFDDAYDLFGNHFYYGVETFQEVTVPLVIAKLKSLL